MEYICNIGSTDSAEFNYFRLELALTETNINKVENTSTATYRLRLYAGSHYFYGYGLGAQIVLDGRVIASRDRQNAPSVSIEKNGYLDILQGEITLSHNPDGTLTLPVAFSIDMTAGTYTPGPMSGAGEVTFSTIARTSTIRGTGANIGEVSMLAITRHSSEFTHSVAYAFGDERGYISSGGEAVEQEEIFDVLSLGFLLPESFYARIPDCPSGTCRLTITTYAGTKSIGTEETTITATANPAVCAPTVSFSVWDCNESTRLVTGDENILVRGQSVVRCQADAQGQKGAVVTSVLINGKEETEFVALTNVFACQVTDSRGYVTRQTLTLPMVDYVALTCHATAQRTSPTDNQVRLQVWGQYFEGNFGDYDNTLVISCYLPDGQALEIPFTVTDNAYQGELVLSDLSYQSTHLLRVEATDRLGTVQQQLVVNRGVPVFDWGQNDFTFHVPVAAQGGVNGVFMQCFSGTSVWLKPETRPQSFFLAGGGILGVLEITQDGCNWQGTEKVTCVPSESGGGVLFGSEIQGVILSHSPWQT